MFTVDKVIGAIVKQVCLNHFFIISFLAYVSTEIDTSNFIGS